MNAREALEVTLICLIGAVIAVPIVLIALMLVLIMLMLGAIVTAAKYPWPWLAAAFFGAVIYLYG